jgi:putative flippase GtrA
MSAVRQGFSFLVIGCGLIAVDWALFVLFTTLGLTPFIANLLGRTVGALLSFLGNGRFTFGSKLESSLGWPAFARFTALWIALTLLSTFMITQVVGRLGLEIAWLAKPLVEGLLAGVSFFVSRQWVYR